MKSTHTLALLTALTLSVSAASATNACAMGDMPMKDKGMSGCIGMPGMDMKGMDMHQQCMDMMKRGSDTQHSAMSGTAMSHQTDAIVKAVDAAQGKVTLAHEPVKSLNWPAMTMAFAVRDKALLDKLRVGKKVHVEFQQVNNDYVVTAVK